MEYFYSLTTFLFNHPLATFCGLSAFIISCWTGYIEQNTIGDIFLSAIVSVFSALCILDLLFKGSHYHLWLPLIGVIVGFVGPYRLRTAVLALWDLYIPIIKKYLKIKFH